MRNYIPSVALEYGALALALSAIVYVVAGQYAALLSGVVGRVAVALAVR